MKKAAIFDMDGLMVNSEPFWQQAQLEIFPQFGVKITRQDTIDTTGVRIDQIVAKYYKSQPWKDVDCASVEKLILNRVIELVETHKPMMPGLLAAIQLFKETGYTLAVASSSPMVLINATLKAFKLEDAFSAVVSAEGLPYGKPHPEVYLNAAQAIDTHPFDCIALEDSFTGLLAAKSAQMRTIIVPEPSHFSQERFVIADVKLQSLEDLTAQMIQNL